LAAKRSDPKRNRLRIIGGEWRGRKLDFPDMEGLRPTPDRVRETLFNWLAPVIDGARCLDLFAGSGALGLEALSRGARGVMMVDNAASVCQSLRAHLERLGSTTGQVVQAAAEDYLRQAPAVPFDIVFLDPPYHLGLLPPCCELLENRGWLAAPATIYLEAERQWSPEFPSGWTLHRSKQAGQVGYHLAVRTVHADS
jgi:16S rRNA (guanine966-N2)-methyltransferase